MSGFIESFKYSLMGPTDIASLKRRLRDYASVGRQLFLQRIIIYSAAIALAGFYYDTITALRFYALIWLGEAFDSYVFREILRWNDRDWRKARYFLRLIFAGTIFSAAVISLFSISLALQQDQSTHFMALFMLFSASIFAAINNHQILSVLVLRLSIYVVALLFIPVWDLLVAKPPLSSPLWMQFFVVLFVLSFIVECCRSYLVGYVKNLDHINALIEEHDKTMAAYRAKQDFLSTVSHELRTPLTSINGSLRLISSGAVGTLPPKMHHLLDMANKNCESLVNLVNDLLDVKSLEAGHIQLDLKPVELSALVSHTVARTKPFAIQHDVTLHLEPAEGEVWVIGDRRRLEQVVVNLLSNAAKFSHAGGRVDIRLDKHDGQVILAVQDYGIGIPEDSYDKVFEQFRQVVSPDARTHGGTGLGMNISKWIVEAHGGDIKFESKKGQGTTFFVLLAEENHSESVPQPDALLAQKAG